MESFRIENLTFTYPGKSEPALRNLNLTMETGRFITLCGQSGCGKTTLLRRLKPSFAPHGDVLGEIYFEGTPAGDLSARDESTKIGFVMQSPENQIVTDKVWHELAFGLESLGFDTETIRLRVAEMASFFGIQDWFHKNVTELSGGQKQLLALASIMAMQPSVLILDEPTSQLDPIAASEFLATVGKINRELGVTVIMTEHRLEEVFPLSDRVVVMDAGRVIADGTPTEIGMVLRGRGHGMFHAMPVPMRVYAAIPSDLPCPVTVRDGREWLEQLTIDNGQWTIEDEGCGERGEPTIELREAWFRYEKDEPDIVRGASFKAYAGEITAILGGNGTGKTTTLSLIAGINTPYRGKVLINGETPEKIRGLFDGVLGVLPQNPQSIFVRKTVEEDLLEMFSGRHKIPKTERIERIRAVASLCRLNGLMQSHPYDLSGGEQQRAALAKVLLLRPRILLLDEPTKGLDAEFKIVFAGILRELTNSGVTVVMVSHDVEFCAEYADRCAMFFDGSVVTESTARKFFSGNSFYTSQANRMARHVLAEAVTAHDIIAALGGTAEPIAAKDGGESADVLYAEKDDQKNEPVIKAGRKLEKWRKAVMCLAALALLSGVFMVAFGYETVTVLISGGAEAVFDDPYAIAYTVGAGGLIILAGILWAVARRDESGFEVQIAAGSRRLSKRTAAAAAIALLAIPLTIYIGVFFLGDRKYNFISLMIVFETMLPFAMVFESRRPQARELVIISVLCAIGVAGRAAFFMLPQFKPVMAIVIIAGVSFGGEAGFLVGAMTAFVSNMFFGQGPWTPWQMFAFGIIGFFAGVLFRKGFLRRSRAALCVYGGLTTFVIYGFIMNTATIFMFQANQTPTMLVAALIQGIPFDLVHAAATIVFLFVTSRPMLEKLDRIKLKYGLMDI